VRIVEPTELLMPSLSAGVLKIAERGYSALTPKQQLKLRELRGSDFRARGALLANLDFIQQEMEATGWTNSSVAEALGISEQAVSGWFKTGEIKPQHLTRVTSNEILGKSLAASAIDCDVHSYRAGIRWVRKDVLQAKKTPKNVPSWKELVLLVAAFKNDFQNDTVAIADLPAALQPHFRSWGRAAKNTPTRIDKTIRKWGEAYRLFVFEEYYRGK